ncbi:tigger transposable element-derived protein 6-like protein [Plakobranchus ocellatus]|uniref:Tigger transposable element-derived protein 6-like protein n=1 Tax=Plakobranchus ocellatus TaxID=259542 RepID=A0AAV3YWY6_9GAST|nr:tigger transposable element-derived protein 6-like protein [Plakobranchus ocellatus]
MPQYCKRKTETEHPTEGRIVAALDAIANGLTLRKAADEFRISKSALQRYQAKHAKQKDDASAPLETPLAPNYQHAQISSAAQEQELLQFIAEVSDMFHGYTYKQLRVFAYDLAVSNKIKIPSSDWQKGFMARNGERLALRAAEPTPLIRTTALSRFNVETFFNYLETCYLKAKSTAGTIYNLDETGCTTKQRPSKVVGKEKLQESWESCW